MLTLAHAFARLGSLCRWCISSFPYTLSHSLSLCRRIVSQQQQKEQQQQQREEPPQGGEAGGDEAQEGEEEEDKEEGADGKKNKGKMRLNEPQV